MIGQFLTAYSLLHLIAVFVLPYGLAFLNQLSSQLTIRLPLSELT